MLSQEPTELLIATGHGIKGRVWSIHLQSHHRAGSSGGLGTGPGEQHPPALLPKVRRQTGISSEGQDLEVLEGDRVELSCEVTPSIINPFKPPVLGGK